MTYRSSFDAKTSTVDSRAVFDFTSELGTGESIYSAATTATVYSGTDASPGTLVSGTTSVSGTQVTQALTGGVIGVTYMLTCVAATSAGHSIVQNGLLQVKAMGI